MSIRMFPVISLLVVLAVSSTAHGEIPTAVAGEGAGLPWEFDTEQGWKLTRDEDGIRSYRLQKEGSPLLLFKGEGIIDAPIDLVLSVVIDAERAGEWIDFLSESVVTRWIEPPGDYVQFTRFDLPWPVTDRVFVSRVELEFDPQTYSAALFYRSCEDQVEFDDAILGSAVGSRYLLRPIDGGARTSLTGIGIADPKGAIPIWVVNWVGGSVLHNTIAALREQVRKNDVAVIPLLKPLYEHFEVEPAYQLISGDPPARD
jgi:hypothetical protein